MLSVLCSSDASVRDTFANILSLEKIDDTPIAIVYRREKWIFTFLKTPLTEDHVHWIASSFLPDRLYFPYLGYSIDAIHEVGDVIVPNVFFSYNRSLPDIEVTETNRDRLIENPRFLESLTEQKDYYVEDFGLSIGGILIDEAPNTANDELMTKMMFAYEGDVYTSASLGVSLDVLEKEIIPTAIIAGIVHGKAHPKNSQLNPLEFTARNMVTTIRLMEDKEE